MVTTIEHQDGSRFWVLDGRITYQKTPQDQPISLAEHVADQVAETARLREELRETEHARDSLSEVVSSLYAEITTVRAELARMRSDINGLAAEWEDNDEECALLEAAAAIRKLTKKLTTPPAPVSPS